MLHSFYLLCHCPRQVHALPTGQSRRSRVYHCISRVVEGRFIFQVSGHGSVEAERFIKLMRRLEAFSGVRVLTYVLMSNHFHLLCEVPEPRTLSEAEVLERVEAGYGPARRQALQEEIARYRQQPDGNAQVQRLLDRYRRPMYDISVFIKELKGRFAQWYNQRHDRYGGPNDSRVSYLKEVRHWPPWLLTSSSTGPRRPV
jgi:putative transposase